MMGGYGGPQYTVGFGVEIDAMGPGVCGTTMLAIPVHPPGPVATTEYVPLKLFTTIDAVLAPPGVHTYDVPPLAVRTTDPPGSQTCPVIVIVGVGFGKIVMGSE